MDTIALIVVKMLLLPRSFACCCCVSILQFREHQTPDIRHCCVKAFSAITSYLLMNLIRNQRSSFEITAII